MNCGVGPKQGRPAEFVRHSQISLDSGVVHDVDPLAVHMAEQKKHNVLFIMADDIGWSNLSAYNLGIMGYRTPNIDRIAKGRRAVHRLLRPAKLHGWSAKPKV